MAGRIVLGALIVGLLGWGCAAGPDVERFAARQIDRPYTLPAELDAWHTLLFTGFSYSDGTTRFAPPIPFPLVFEQSLAEDWTLDWALIPISVRHQILHDETNTIGAKLGLRSLGFSSQEDLIIGIGVEGVYRRILAESFALTTSLGVNPTYSSSSRRVSAELVWSLHPVVQLTDEVALGLSVSPSLRLSRNDRARFTVPMSLRLSGRLDPQWELSGSYLWSSELDFDPQTHILVFDLAHYW